MGSSGEEQWPLQYIQCTIQITISVYNKYGLAVSMQTDMGHMQQTPSVRSSISTKQLL